MCDTVAMPYSNNQDYGYPDQVMHKFFSQFRISNPNLNEVNDLPMELLDNSHALELPSTDDTSMYLNLEEQDHRHDSSFTLPYMIPLQRQDPFSQFPVPSRQDSFGQYQRQEQVQLTAPPMATPARQDSLGSIFATIPVPTRQDSFGLFHLRQDNFVNMPARCNVIQDPLPPIKVEPLEVIPKEPAKPKNSSMDCFPVERVVDFKHLIYNLLCDNYNHPGQHTFVQRFSMEVLPGIVKHGFKFNEAENPEKRLPELYAQHIRKANLQLENQTSVFIQDLYKFYLRACVELLSKYFQKMDKFSFLYDDIPLFVPGSSLEEAEERISKMGTIQRKHKRNGSLEVKQTKVESRKRSSSVDPFSSKKKKGKCSN